MQPATEEAYRRITETAKQALLQLDASVKNATPISNRQLEDSIRAQTDLKTQLADAKLKYDALATTLHHTKAQHDEAAKSLETMSKRLYQEVQTANAAREEIKHLKTLSTRVDVTQMEGALKQAQELGNAIASLKHANERIESLQTELRTRPTPITSNQIGSAGQNDVNAKLNLTFSDFLTIQDTSTTPHALDFRLVTRDEKIHIGVEVKNGAKLDGEEIKTFTTNLAHVNCRPLHAAILFCNKPSCKFPGTMPLEPTGHVHRTRIEGKIVCFIGMQSFDCLVEQIHNIIVQIRIDAAELARQQHQQTPGIAQLNQALNTMAELQNHSVDTFDKMQTVVRDAVNTTITKSVAAKAALQASHTANERLFPFDVIRNLKVLKQLQKPKNQVEPATKPPVATKRKTPAPATKNR